MPVRQILVPQGPEYNRVVRGLRAAARAGAAIPEAIAMPMGPQAADKAAELPQNPDGVLLVGLCGSLSPEHRVGDLVLYQDCHELQGSSEVLPCDRALTDWVTRRLTSRIASVKSLTSDRLIHRAAEKRQLRDRYGADVVDMEGAAVLRSLGARSVAMLRVVSDGCTGDLPDLSPAIGPDGSLKPLPMAVCFARQPLAAVRLVRGSLHGLGVLETAIAELFAS